MYQTKHRHLDYLKYFLKMILVDISQIAISSLMSQMGMNKGVLNEDMARHFILNSLRMYRNKFKDEYGELVICADGKNVWRKKVYPNYKANRKKSRSSDSNDWSEIYRIIDGILKDLDETFPYKYIRLEGAEADDVIAAIVMHETANITENWMLNPVEKIMIVSGDKDMGQLQRYPNVRQYSPLTKKYIDVKNADVYLKEHIIRGDRGDFIPNCLSDDSVLIEDRRQIVLSKKRFEYLMNTDVEDYTNDTEKIGFARNKKLIDLTQIPTELYDEIIRLYEQTPNGSRAKLLTYFIKNKLKNLIEHLSEF